MPAWRAPNLEGAFQAVRRNEALFLNAAEALNAANPPYMVVGAQAVNAWIATIDEGATHAASARNVHQSARRSSYRTTPSSPARPIAPAETNRKPNFSITPIDGVRCGNVSPTIRSSPLCANAQSTSARTISVAYPRRWNAGSTA